MDYFSMIAEASIYSTLLDLEWLMEIRKDCVNVIRKECGNVIDHMLWFVIEYVYLNIYYIHIKHP